MSAFDGPILLIGCGKMGGALLEGWLARGAAAPADIRIVEPDAQRAADLRARHRVETVAAVDALDPAFAPAVVALAVKPQVMDAALAPCRRFVGPEVVFLSIAAGKTLAYFARVLGADAAIVRAMPNTPAAVGCGITVLAANANASAAQRARCQALLEAVGETVWAEGDDLFDAVTAVSGSGPAYVFLLIECLARAGVAAGLPESLAMRLARATVYGAGVLAARSDEPAAALRRNVTSPGGTTEAALGVLMADDGLEALMVRAVAAAARRSRELAD